MSRREWRDAGKERLWRGLVRDWQRSGLTIRDFCAERGLAEHNFHAWRRTLAARDKEKALPPFVPLQVEGAFVSEPAAGIEIIFLDGIVVRVRAGVDEATLRLVLALLAKERPC